MAVTRVLHRFHAARTHLLLFPRFSLTRPPRAMAHITCPLQHCRTVWWSSRWNWNR